MHQYYDHRYSDTLVLRSQYFHMMTSTDMRQDKGLCAEL